MPLVYPIREDDRTLKKLRRDEGMTKRQRRQAPPPTEVKRDDESEIEDGEDSDDEGSTSPVQSQVSTLPPPPSTTASVRSTLTPAVPAETSSSKSPPQTTLLISTATNRRSSSTTSSPADTPTITQTIFEPSTEGNRNFQPGTTTSTISPISALPDTEKPTNPPGRQPHTTITHGQTVVLTVVGVGAGAAILFTILFFCYRRFKKRRSQQIDSPPSKPSRFGFGGLTAIVGKIRGGRSASNTNQADPPTWEPVFARPVTMAQVEGGGIGTVFMASSRSVRDRQSGLTNNAVERQERLGRVRADLLGPKELGGGLMRSQTQRMPMPIVPPAILNAKGSGGPVGSGWGGEGRAGNFNSGMLKRVRNELMAEKDRIDIEASGRWEEPVTVARNYSRDFSSAGVAGGTAGAGQNGGNEAGVVSPRNGHRYTTSIGEAESAVLPRPQFMEQSRFSETKSTTTATTDSRDFFGSSSSGTVTVPGTPAARNTKYFSRSRESGATMPKWKDPVGWVKDQVERTKEREGMQRLPD